MFQLFKKSIEEWTLFDLLITFIATAFLSVWLYNMVQNFSTDLPVIMAISIIPLAIVLVIIEVVNSLMYKIIKNVNIVNRIQGFAIAVIALMYIVNLNLMPWPDFSHVDFSYLFENLSM